MIVTLQPTSNVSPDPGQGGNAVTSPTNTGHGSTTSTGNNSTVIKTCKWTAFPAKPAVGLIKSITLKFDWTRNGRVDDVAHSSNELIADYSLNSGGAWTNIFDFANFTDNTGNSVSVTLPLTQDTTTVQVRDQGVGESDTPGIVGQVIFSISNIKIEVDIFTPSFLD